MYNDKKKQSAYQNAWRKKNRANFLSDKVCEQCGETDRLRPRKRQDTPYYKSTYLWGLGREKFEEKIKLFKILCYLCYREDIRASRKRTPCKLGKVSSYKYGCRCDICQRAQNMQKDTLRGHVFLKDIEKTT